MSKTYRIGDLARRLSVGVETIRYYEREGLLPKPARSERNYRLYDTAERERLAFILHCRALDMTHEEIRGLLRLRDAPEGGCAEVNTLLDEHIRHVAERIRVLRTLQRELNDLRARCEAPSTSKECGILRGLGASARPRGGSGRTAVHGSPRGR